ncbi:MAG: dihydroorotate dehydrogenase electron transfer subunit [Candidatus Marinimicrobia bacterium]|nr:dihydroorotate dehydrogenase electron transfer subunit [Candidatus Neomarinimicrobiota bacterium]MBL7022748.1 dihydroorotate dehydrogenase electron transfer subunit [Candidatus Neomarinimicrobiota bacterium]MBL7109614.1 dihydroorotate dehydrogenase electron transfer subunit [Candidatus Neomarinimicrobiota bacterium]
MMIQEITIVSTVNEIAENTYQAKLIAPKIASVCKPGQFINILPSETWKSVMRRPMSIAGQNGDEIQIIFKVVGKGTQIMSRWKSNDKVDIIGPLGNFWSGLEDKLPILLGGGVGIAPILYLHNFLNENSISHYLVMGAKTKCEHFICHNPEDRVLLTTDDGSIGIHGTVIDGLKNILYQPKDIAEMKIFACGPPMMNKFVKRFAIENDIECYIALETLMACGFGNCQGCAVERNVDNKTDHSYRQKYALVCKDGPIFNAKDIVKC